LLQRAAEAGYQAIVLTLDGTLQQPSRQALRAGFRMPADVRPVNLAGRPEDAGNSPGNSAGKVFEHYRRHAPAPDELHWLLDRSPLPVIAKGVLDARDALALRQAGVAGLVVSNHGGRTLDGVTDSLSALAGIRSAVGGDYPLLFDGGIRSGADVFKAIALGADAVLIGRLQVYALAVAGALGVAHMLRLLREELELCMATCGCASLDRIGRDALCDRLAPAAEDPRC
jgi:isopentenyl diphosphate isomerase/L-lactate dehydrogenase-like FMN-dependent dehydrogenase